MPFSQDEIKEFEIEALDLLDAAEKALLALDAGASLSSHYDSIFRAFHSIKGAAGMMELFELQSHMHQLETLFVGTKSEASLSKGMIDLFLRGCDASRLIFKGEKVSFIYEASPSAKIGDKAPQQASVAEEDVSKSSFQGSTSDKSIPIKELSLRNGKVFILDDEVEIVELLKEMLEDAHFEVQGCTDAKKSIELIKSYSPDVILSDLSMPEMSGIEVLNEVRKINTELPIIFVSGHIEKDILMKSIALGIYGIIEKPFKVNDVVQICMNAGQKYQLSKLLNQSINLLLYQFSDLNDYLKAQGKDEVRVILKKEIETLVERRKLLKNISAKNKLRNSSINLEKFCNVLTF